MREEDRERMERIFEDIFNEGGGTVARQNSIFDRDEYKCACGNFKVRSAVVCNECLMKASGYGSSTGRDTGKKEEENLAVYRKEIG